MRCALVRLWPPVLLGIALAGQHTCRADTSSHPPQLLPITAQWCPESPTRTNRSARDCFQLEVPAGERQYAWGLQMRPPLPPHRGMWFVFQPPSIARFWMHRTLIPLDMLFIRQQRVLAIAAAVPPCARLPCPTYGPEEPVDGVLELAAGEAKRLGVVVGTPIRITPMPALR